MLPIYPGLLRARFANPEYDSLAKMTQAQAKNVIAR